MRIDISSVAIALLTSALAISSPVGLEARDGGADEPDAELVVTSTADAGPGSLREVIAEANHRPGHDTITFDPAVFAEPRTIVLQTGLPEITGDLTIDGYIPDRLWKATGVTVQGAPGTPAFRIGVTASVTMRHLTVADSCAAAGAGIVNLGDLVLRGVTFRDNEAAGDGGAVLNLGGSLIVVNATFARNRAGDRGGAVANVGGAATVTNCTFSDNAGPVGAGLFSDGELLLRNTILANSEAGPDCVAVRVDPASTRNLIEHGEGCGTPITSTDPDLEPLGYFNGPVQTYPLRGGSHAINLGDNAAAVDEHGLPLVWDQRGNGDPRFVAGYTDLGAFEYQRHPYLVVDTLEDGDLRACTKPGKGDCPLRGALELADAKDTPQTITFDTRVFADGGTITVSRPLPGITNHITLDATGTGGVRVVPGDGIPLFAEAPGEALRVIEVELAEPASATTPQTTPDAPKAPGD